MQNKPKRYLFRIITENKLSNFSIIRSNIQNMDLFIIPRQRMYQANMMFSREK